MSTECIIVIVIVGLFQLLDIVQFKVVRELINDLKDK